MEPHREEPQKALEASTAQKPKRFRIVKLEERIAPTKGGNVSHGHATACGPTCPTDGCTVGCTAVYTVCGCPIPTQGCGW
jgi:hypothetical protein